MNSVNYNQDNPKEYLISVQHSKTAEDQNKDKILKAVGEKKMHYFHKSNNKSSSWLNRNHRNQKTNNGLARILYPKIKGEREKISDNQKLREFVSSQPAVKD